MVFRNKHLFLWCIGFLAAAVLFSGCATPGRNGTLRLSRAASDAFESGTVLPDHAYYYTGSENNPNAVIAVHSDYVLVTNRWKYVVATEKRISDWVEIITDFRGYGLWTYGSDILGPQREYIGIWYSKKSNFTTVKLLDGNQVMVFPPDEDSSLYRRPGFFFYYQN